MERALHFSKLPFDPSIIKGPELPPRKKLINAKKRARIAWNEDRKVKRKKGLSLDEYVGFKCSHCKTTGHEDIEAHMKECETYKLYVKNSVRVPFQKIIKH